MLLRLFLLFTLVPVVELALLIRIGGLIGLLPTLALVIGTGAAGAWLARREGLRSWTAVQRELAGGKVPGEELVHGMLILIAGVVLLTPGILTDIAGLALLVRPVRRALIRRFRERFRSQIESGAVGVVGGPGSGFIWTAGFGGMDRAGDGAPGRPEGGTPDSGEAGRSTAYPRGREIVVDDEEPRGAGPGADPRRDASARQGADAERIERV